MQIRNLTRESYLEIMKYCGYTTDLMKGFDLLLNIASNKIKMKKLQILP